MATKVCNSCKKIMRFEDTHCPSCGAEYKPSTPKWMIGIAILVALVFGVVMGMPKSNTSESTEKSARVAAIEQQTNSRMDLLNHLKDPSSAEIRNHSGNCGEVNSKNSFGGYTGFKRFIATPTIVMIEGEVIDPAEFQKAWEQACK